MAVADTDVNIFDDTENSGNNGGGGGGGITEIESETLEVSKSGNKVNVNVDVYSSDGSVDVQLDTSDPNYPYWDLKVDIPPTPDLVTEEKDGLARALDKEIHDHSYANVAHRTPSSTAEDANEQLSSIDEQYSPKYGQMEQWLDPEMKLRTSRYETIPEWNLPISAEWSGACFDKVHGTFVVLDKAANGTAYGQLWVAVRQFGSNWDVIKPGLADESWRHIACSDNGVIIALSGNSSREIAISYDGGYTWKLSTLPSSQYWETVKARGDFFYFTSLNQIIVTNSDASTVVKSINRISGETEIYDSCFGNIEDENGYIIYAMFRLSLISGSRKILYEHSDNVQIKCTFISPSYDRIAQTIHPSNLINGIAYGSLVVAYSSFLRSSVVGVCGIGENPSDDGVLSEIDYSIDGHLTIGVDLFTYGDRENVNGYYYVCYDTITNITHIYDRRSTLFVDSSEKGEDHQFEGKFMNALMIEGNVLLFDGARVIADEHKGSNAILVNINTWEIVDINEQWKEVFTLQNDKQGLLANFGEGFDGVGIEKDYMKMEKVGDDPTPYVLETVHSDRTTEYANYPMYSIGGQSYDIVYCNVAISNMINNETQVYADEECTTVVGIVVSHGDNIHNPNNVTVLINGVNEVYDFSADKTPKALATTKAILDLKQEVENMANFGIQSKSISISQNGTITITPDDGKLLSEVEVNVDVQGGGDVGNAVYYRNNQSNPWISVAVTWSTDHYVATPATSPGFSVAITKDGNEPAADLSNIVSMFNWTSGTTFGIDALIPFSYDHGIAPIIISL